jgi:hypothetical protein
MHVIEIFTTVSKEKLPGIVVVGAMGGESGFDAHAVYAGDNAMSAGARSSLATEGVRNTLAALLSRYNHQQAAQSLHTGNTLADIIYGTKKECDIQNCLSNKTYFLAAVLFLKKVKSYE